MKCEKPLLSVIIPVYNAEQYIQRCLDSVRNQTYTNLEIVCINDGSTDNSLEILNANREKDSRIKVSSRENGGLVNARKEGLKLASADFVTYVDADDYIEKDMYDSLMEIIVQQNVDVVTSGLIRDYGNKLVKELETFSPGIYSGESLNNLCARIIDIESFYKTNISMHVTNKIYKKDVLTSFQNNIPDNVSIGEDAALVIPLVYKCNSVFVSGMCFYHYCIRPDSMMKAESLGKRDPIYQMLTYVEKTMKQYSETEISFDRQYEYFSLYYRLLRNPEEVFNYDDKYLFPYGKLSKTETIVIYGAGKYGVALKKYLEQEGFQKLIWVDQNYGHSGIISLEEALRIGFDRILIGALIYDTQQSIRNRISACGVSEEKVLSISFS